MRRGDRSRPMLCVAAVALVATLLAACGDDEAAEEPAPAGGDQAAKQTFTISAGEADESLQNGGLLAFYPASVSVHPGDTLVFENGSGAIAIPHTVTLGTPADIPNRIPPPVVPEVGQVPAVWGQCVSDQPLDKGATDCPEGSSEFPPAEDVVTMPAFTSQSYYNSGIFDPGQSVEMEVDADPGTYNFFCYLHPATMTMSVDVVDAEEQIPTQQELDALAEEQRQADLADAQQALEAAQSADRPAATVMAGSEEGAAVITAFFPEEITVSEGTEVTWVNKGFDPHVVSLEKGVGPHDPQNFAPPSAPPGSDYDGGFVISGVFGRPFPSQSFSLRFTDAGEYGYVCPIHPGMGGTVRVTPS